MNYVLRSKFFKFDKRPISLGMVPSIEFERRLISTRLSMSPKALNNSPPRSFPAVDIV